MRRAILDVVAQIVLLIAATAVIASASGSDMRQLVPGVDFVEGEVIITLKPAFTPSKAQVNLRAARLGIETLDRALGAYNPVEMRKLIPSYGRYTHEAAQRLERTFIFRYGDAVDAREVLDRLSQLPPVERVTLNRIVTFELHGVPRFEPDPATAFASQWNLDNTNDTIDIDAPEAWAIEKGDPDLIIGIFDEGTQINPCDGANWLFHSDLNYFFQSGEDISFPGPDDGDLNGIDDNGDGWIDNVVGINTDHRCPDPFTDAVPTDWKYYDIGKPPPCYIIGMSTGHGIATGGVAAGQHEGMDVAGIAPNCLVHYARFSLRNLGDTFENMAAAVMYLADMAAVVNMSFGSNASGDFGVISDAFTAAAQDPALDCLFIASTGNNGTTQTKIAFPARHPDVMAVGAMAENGALCGYSQWDHSAEKVDVVAPVGNGGIPVNKHTNPCSGQGACEVCEVINQMIEYVDNWAGTSFSAPQAAGIAALIRSRFPALDQGEVRERIKNSAEYYWDGDPDGHKKYGAGKVNAYLALTEFGHITESTTWGAVSGMPDTMIVSGDLVIDPNVTLTINPGTVILVACDDARHDEVDGIDPYRVEIIVKGSLVIGTEGSGDIEFASYCDSPGTTDWYGIRYLAGAGLSPLAGVTIKHAYIAVRSDIDITIEGSTVSDGWLGVWSIGGATVTGTTFSGLSIAVQIRSGDATINGVTISNCGSGIDFFTPNGETSTLACRNTSLTGCGVSTSAYGSGYNTVDLNDVTVSESQNSGIVLLTGSCGSIDSCTVNGNSMGIVLYSTNGVSITDCSIEGNTNYGVFAMSGSGHSITGNTITGSTHGIYFFGTQNTAVEYNNINGNTVGVSTLDESNADLGGGGAGSSGYNSITNNSLHHVGNLNMSTTIMAEHNWWGSPAGPHPTKIAGSVDYDPWLTQPPGTPLPFPDSAGEDDPAGKLPRVNALAGVFPNPFNPSATIVYSITEPGSLVEIVIYDSSGRPVRTLVGEYVPPGTHTIAWDGTGNSGLPCASGIYFVRMTAGNFQATKKLVLMK